MTHRYPPWAASSGELSDPLRPPAPAPARCGRVSRRGRARGSRPPEAPTGAAGSPAPVGGRSPPGSCVPFGPQTSSTSSAVVWCRTPTERASRRVLAASTSWPSASWTRGGSPSAAPLQVRRRGRDGRCSCGDSSVSSEVAHSESSQAEPDELGRPPAQVLRPRGATPRAAALPPPAGGRNRLLRAGHDLVAEWLAVKAPRMTEIPGGLAGTERVVKLGSRCLRKRA
jgi:hypothetical protein